MSTWGEGYATLVASHALETCVAIAKAQGMTLDGLVELVRITWHHQPALTEPQHTVPERVRARAEALQQAGRYQDAAALLLGHIQAQGLAATFARRFPGGVMPDTERNWDSMPPSAADDDPYGNADHDQAVCDCEACENARRADASHEGTQIQTFEVKRRTDG